MGERLLEAVPVRADTNTRFGVFSETARNAGAYYRLCDRLCDEQRKSSERTIKTRQLTLTVADQERRYYERDAEHAS